MPPRPLRPKDEPVDPKDRDTVLDNKLSKRKAVSSACIPCRKRKSKCDGALPSCSTCNAVYRTECYYDADSDHRRKGALKRDLRSLQQQNDALDVIVASLRSLPEDEAGLLLHNLRDDDTSPDALANVLRDNVNLGSSSGPQSFERDHIRSASPSSRIKRETASRQNSTDYNPSSSSTAAALESTARWFVAPQDAEFVEHLLNLYFCWVHPFYQFFSRDHFIHNMGRGKTDFCSPILVNALLSIACHYSDRSAARAPRGGPNTAGDHFFAEAKQALDSIDKPSLTTVQALAIMSVREASQGRDSNGYQYAGRAGRMSLEIGLHLSTLGSGMHPAELEVRRITFWGVFNLETMLSVAFGRLSQLPRAAADIPKPAINDRTENQTWRPYEDTNLASSQSAEQPAQAMAFTEQLSRLSELASDMVNTFYAPRDKLTKDGLASAYAMFQNWYQNLPTIFWLENTALPHVLVMHMYYHTCVLHLFKPYIRFDMHDVNLFPRDICTTSANRISALMNALCGMYGLRRVCPAVPSFLLSATTTHLLNLPVDSANTPLSQGIQALQTMSSNHPYATECVHIISSLASKLNITFPNDVALAPYTPSVSRPLQSPTSSTFWAASIPRKDSSGGPTSTGSSASHQSSPFQPPTRGQQPLSQQVYMDSPTHLDSPHGQTMFWGPFPTQAMPMTAQHIVPSMSFSTMQTTSSQWQNFGNAIDQPQMSEALRQQGQPEAMNESLDYHDWPNWQRS